MREFLHNARNLKTLSLNQCVDLHGELPTLELTQLETLHLDGSSISTQALHALFCGTKNLKDVDLGMLSSRDINHDVLFENIDLALFDFFKVERFICNNSGINALGLFTLLQKAKNLKHLALSQCHDLSTNLPPELLENLDFTQLESLNFNNSNINIHTLCAILHKAKNLKILRLNGCNLSQNEFFENLNLANLEELRASKTNIDTPTLSLILHHTKKLKSLDLSYCANVKALPKNLALEHLIECGLSPNINTQSWVTFFRKATNLSDVLFSFNSDEWYDRDDELENLDFPHNLSYLIISSSRISAQHLCRILKRAEHVQYTSVLIGDIRDIEKLTYYMDEYALSPRMRELIHERFLTEENAQIPAPYDHTSIHQSISHEAKNAESQPSVDANTAFSKKTFHLKRQFLGKPRTPAPNDIRQTLFDGFTLNPDSHSMKHPFILQEKTIHPSDLQPISAKQIFSPLYLEYEASGDNHYYFRDELHLTHQWQTLPSLYNDEQLHAYALEPLVNVDIRYDPHLGMHVIRLKDDEPPAVTVNVELLLSHTPSLAFNDLPDAIRHLINDCCDFKDTQLTGISPDATAEDYLNALVKQRKGACRHRAIVFKHLMAQQHADIPVRIVSNACHMYAEVFYANQWIKCDLGGYDARLDIDESNMPHQTTARGEEGSAYSAPQDLHSLSLSSQGKPLPAGFLREARNLTSLTLKGTAAFPDVQLSSLGTLIFEHYTFTADKLHHMFQRTPYVRTLKLLHCHITEEEFAKIDLSLLKQLEQVQLQGDFLPNRAALDRLVATAPASVEWLVESDRLLDNDEPDTVLPNAHEPDLKMPANAASLLQNPSVIPRPTSTVLDITETKRKPIAHRFFPSPKQHLDAAVQLLQLLQSHQNKSTLVDTDHAEALRLALTQRAQGLERPCYYIHSPEELRIAEAYIKRQGLEGEIVKERGGPLYDFLTAAHPQPPLLLINFNAFKPDDIVRCNTLLDEAPSVDGVPIPANCQIIGLYNRSHPGAYTGADFTSRFDAQMVFKHPLPEVTKPRLTPLEHLPATTERTAVIEFSGDIGWEKIISGHWSLHNKQWHFEEGALLKAIHDGKTEFVFNNAPLDSPEFQRFLQDFYLHQGVYHRGEWFAQKPLDAQIHFTQQAPLYSEVFQGHTEPTLPVPCFLLNRVHTSPMFTTLANNEDGALNFDAGLIEQFSGKTLSVYLTTPLPPDLWPKVYQQCKQFKTTLNISCAPNVTLPSTLLAESPPPVVLPLVEHTQVCTEIPQIIDADNTEVIDISEVLASDLITHPKASIDLATGRCECSVVEKHLDKALACGKTIILKGTWSESLSAALHPVLYKRVHAQHPQGKLVVVSDKPALFSSLSVTPVEARVEAARPAIHEQAQYPERLQKVHSILKNEPTVLLSGATGVGKTHFIANAWMAAHPACHYGEEHLIDWLQDTRAGLKTLFIDEANIIDKQWTLFEGLYRTPPAVFYQGTYYKLTPEHKVIFAGNPLSYGGERELSTFFAKHPCQVDFQPLPTAVFKATLGLDDDAVKPVLAMVDYVTHLDPSDTLLTPREIVMIAHLTRAFMEQNLAQDAQQTSQYFAYEICKQHIPTSHLNDFKAKFQPQVRLPYPAISLPQFVINDRNADAIQALYAHLQLRAARIAPNPTLPLTGGLGGLVLEGSPGIGKSAMVKEMFAALGLKEHRDFISLPVKLGQKQKERALLDAFHQGQVVMMDEINSSPMLERLLNALLEGHDLEGNPAKNPGFMLVGTQNPITFSGRLQTTLPLKHRLQTIKIEDYTHADILSILKHMQIPPRIAKAMLDEMKLNPALCFRDVQKAARKWKENPTHQKAIQIELQALPQLGSICKTVAIANVENHYAQTLGYEPIPLRSHKTASFSIRKLVKKNGSEQGEILEFNQWQKSFTDLGFETQAIDIKDDFHLFLDTIATQLQQGNLPLIAFAVNQESGLANPEPLEPETTEHAAVITGYNPSTDKITLAHWGQSYVVNATDLFHSSNALTETRSPEYYRKNPAYTETTKNTVEKYTPSTQTRAERTSVTPTQGSGFQAKLLVVKQPNNLEELRQRRGKIRQPTPELFLNPTFWNTKKDAPQKHLENHPKRHKPALRNMLDKPSRPK